MSSRANVSQQIKLNCEERAEDVIFFIIVLKIGSSFLKECIKFRNCYGPGDSDLKDGSIFDAYHISMYCICIIRGSWHDKTFQEITIGSEVHSSANESLKLGMMTHSFDIQTFVRTFNKWYFFRIHTARRLGIFIYKKLLTKKKMAVSSQLIIWNEKKIIIIEDAISPSSLLKTNSKEVNSIKCFSLKSFNWIFVAGIRTQAVSFFFF